jgi:2-oxoisovalerate dehydrogenase E1 component
MGKAKPSKKKAAGKTAKKVSKKKLTKKSDDRIVELLAYGAVTADGLLTFLRRMCEIRYFEEKVFDLLGRNIIKGASHLYAGQEAVAVGAVAAIEESDLVTSTHRGHGHCHAMGDLHAGSSDDKQQHLNKMMAELCGKATGYCRGRGGSMHIADVEEGNLGATGIVGGNIPVAVGAALACKMRKTGQVVLCFFGDGASNTGGFHEALNMAATWDLPVVFICENNLYGMSVPFAEATKIPEVFQRAFAYGFEGVPADGMDVLEVMDVVKRAVARAREGSGPTLIECKTYRWYGHSRSDPRAYRTREEEKQWKERCPIETFKKRLVEAEVASKKEVDAVERRAAEAIDAATEFALSSPDPPVEELYDGLYVEEKPSRQEIEAERQLRERVRSDAGMREMTFGQALVEAAAEEMERDEHVFIMGEDVGLYGGAYGATRGLFDRFGGERVRDTAISEAAISGGCVGAAMAGMRPIGEIMYIDFTPIGMDQLANQGAKNRYMFGGKTRVPLVMRTEGGAGRCIAAHHSQSLEALWMHFPGIYVVMPATPYDAKGLLKSAVRSDNPILFIEHKMLYGTKGRVPEEEYTIPIGLADVKRAGKDVTVLAYSRMLLRALEAAEELAKDGIEAEVIDPRTLKPLDTQAIIDSVKKTGRFVVVSEGYRMNGFAAEAIATVNDLAFDYLDAPMVRVAAADVPVPMSEVLEDEAIPNVADIVAGVKSIL